MEQFNVGKGYSRAEVNRALGGGSTQAYMITIGGGPVLAACVGDKYNKRLPGEIWPGTGKLIVRNAELAASQTEPLHLFLKRGNKDFVYQGRVSAEASYDAREIAAAEVMSERTVEPRISMILKLTPVQ